MNTYIQGGLGYGSEAGHMLSLHESLGSIPSLLPPSPLKDAEPNLHPWFSLKDIIYDFLVYFP